MEVILLQDVEQLGLKGDVVDVKRGYARNFLLPRQLAEVATPGGSRRSSGSRPTARARGADPPSRPQRSPTRSARPCSASRSSPARRASLFGSVTPTDIADEIWRTRKIRVDRRKIDVDAIKRIGRYAVPIHVFEGVTAEVKTLVVPEGGELPPEEELAAMEAAEAAEAEAEAAGRVTEDGRRSRSVARRGARPRRRPRQPRTPSSCQSADGGRSRSRRSRPTGVEKSR